MALNQFCGCFAMLNFTATIFKESGSTLSPNVSSIIVGGIQIVGAVLCTFLVEKTGRKSLLSISSFGVSFGLAALSLYTFSTSRGVNLSGFSWIPLTAFSFVIFISNLGVLTLPFVYVSEIVPTKIKGFTMVLCLVLLYIFATIVIQVGSHAANPETKYLILPSAVFIDSHRSTRNAWRDAAVLDKFLRWCNRYCVLFARNERKKLRGDLQALGRMRSG